MSICFESAVTSLLIHFIRALFDEKPSEYPDISAFYGFQKDIDYYSIAPQVLFLLKRNCSLERTPSFFQRDLLQRFHTTLHQNLYIKQQTSKIFDELERMGIPVIPLKGVSFSEKYFGHIAARNTSDIDLLIRQPDFAKASVVIQNLGFTAIGKPNASHFHSSFSKPLPNSILPLTVELHWDLLTENTSDFAIEPFWEEAKPLDPYRYVLELSNYHTFYMICLHGWKHAMNSMKYFIDIIQLVHMLGDRLDYARLFQDAAAHRTYRRMLSTLSIVYREFPHLHEIQPLPLRNDSPLWWDYHSIREKKPSRRLANYVRLAKYQLLDYDTLRHSLAASYQYVQSVRKSRGPK